MKLFVGNFSFSTTEADLQSLFAPYGNIESVTVVTDRQTGRSRGCTGRVSVEATRVA